MKEDPTIEGLYLVVLDRGFVYIGEVELTTNFCVIRSAYNVRTWGTTKGLGELATDGPTSSSVLDKVGIIYAPMRSVIHLIKTDKAKWKQLYP